MENIEEQIFSYPHLPAEKQRDVEAYVEAHPEWAPLLQDVRSIESLVQGIAEPNSSDALLTTYIVVQHLHPEETPSELAEAFRRLEQRMEANPDLQERAGATRQRLEEAEAAVDPVAQFEELTDHSLEPAAEEASAPTDTRETARDREAAPSLRSFVDDLLRLPLAVRWAGAAVALLIGTYGILFATSEASQSTLDRLATVNVSDQVVDNYTSTATRSATPSSDTVTSDQLYVDALAAVQEARTATLGLFPSYDADKLDRAERLLKQVLDRTEPGSFLALEAQYYLGKVYLARGQVETARSHLKTVVEREGRMADKARDILETLHEEYPIGNGTG